MQPERISATYRVETPLPIDQAAGVLAGEQSSGTFVEVPGETEDIRNRYRARVERITELESVDQPSLPGSRAKGGVKKLSPRGDRRLLGDRKRRLQSADAHLDTSRKSL